MRRVFLLTSMAVLGVLVSSPLYLLANYRSYQNQFVPVSEDIRKMDQSSSSEEIANLGRGQGLISENWTTEEQVDTNSETSIGQNTVETPSEKLFPDETNDTSPRTNDSSDGTNQSEELPLPDGRLFFGGEAPYGYVPTCHPKQNISLLLLPLDLDS